MMAKLSKTEEDEIAAEMRHIRDNRIAIFTEHPSDQTFEHFEKAIELGKAEALAWEKHRRDDGQAEFSDEPWEVAV